MDSNSFRSVTFVENRFYNRFQPEFPGQAKDKNKKECQEIKKEYIFFHGAVRNENQQLITAFRSSDKAFCFNYLMEILKKF